AEHEMRKTDRILTRNELLSIVGNFAHARISIFNPCPELKKIWHSNERLWHSSNMLHMAALMTKAYFSYQTYQSYQSQVIGFLRFKKTCDYLHQQIRHFSRLLDILNQIKILANEHPALKELTCYKVIEDTLNLEHSDLEFKNLVTLLRSDIFKQNDPGYSHFGHTLVTYSLLRNQLTKIAPLLEVIGELDTHMTTARTLKKYTTEGQPWCFATYEDGEQPHVKLTNVRNPMLERAKAVGNDLELGKNGKGRVMVLSGKNTHGKSALLKGGMWSVVEGQTLTVVSNAPEATFTPFDCLASTLNTAGDTKASDYMSELNRMEEVLTVIQKSQKCFTMQDEQFRSTNPTDAGSNAKRYNALLAHMPSVCSISATHFTPPTQLEEATGNVCANYKMTAGFKLERGVELEGNAALLFEERIRPYVQRVEHARPVALALAGLR
ncbi:MAG TPA: hypothetical protein VLG71_03200, partial [Candidatus Limnocylindria bacterium]|nr:hypothetical protein [Candidatus Limnocylindria bacterium]